ncbi:hypothetical protein L7F22_024136 [Adiantum nelumboides]|nr:hypothetical protein [Adiantum nelumboides]
MADNNIDVFKMFAAEDRLDGDNYPMWAYMMQHVLVSKDVWNIVQGIDVRLGTVDVAKVVDVAGEAMTAIPVIKHCMLMRPSLNILLTTSTVAAYFVLQQVLPAEVLCQFAPVDTPAATESFFTHWHPEAGIFMESELWPNLLTCASQKGMKLALLNARMSAKSYNRWLLPLARHLVTHLLSRFNLIIPLSTEEATRYQILGAPPMVVQFAGNLKYGSFPYFTGMHVLLIYFVEFILMMHTHLSQFLAC